MTDAVPPKRNNRIPIAIAVAGIVIELVTVGLIASNTISSTAGTPLVMLGMFMAMVPIFALARRAKDRR